MSERLLREWVRASLLLEATFASYTSVAKKLISMITVDGKPVYKKGSKSAQVRLTPADNMNEIAKGFKEDDFKKFLTDAGYEVSDVYDVSMPENVYSGSYSAFMITDPNQPDADPMAIVFGVRGGTPVSIQNERDFAASINSHVTKDSEGEPVPIKLNIGNHTIENVVGAKTAGQSKVEVTSYDEEGNEISVKETSKADVNVLLGNGNVYPVSIKMPTAAYWLSGDAKIPTKQIIQVLLAQPAPSPRIIEDPNDPGNYRAVEGPEDNPNFIDIKFTLPADLEMEAVFGTEKNPVGIVAKGNFRHAPVWDEDQGILSWGKGVVYRREDGIGGLPEDQRPWGLLRRGEKISGRDLRRGTKGYPGIRPAATTSARAQNAVNIDDILAKPLSPKPISESNIVRGEALMRKLVREFIFTEQANKFRK